jgi:hypothetical protein
VGRFVGLASGSDPSGVLLQYGAIGAICVLLAAATAYVFKQYVKSRDAERDELLRRLDEARTRAEKTEDQLADLNNLVQTQTMAALNEATRAVTDAINRMRRT